nr:MAG TPA: helix-turn-helix domain protein [Bacteriophage sp.]
MEQQQKRDFKGVWIPKEIWLAGDLTLTEKALWAEIDSLDGKDGCWATNAYFEQQLGLKKKTVSELINGLVKKGYVKSRIKYKDTANNKKVVDKRILRINEKKSKKGNDRRKKKVAKTPPAEIGGGIPPESDRVSGLNRRYIDNKEDNIEDNISQQAPIPAESVRKEKPKSLWDISREITGNDPFTFPYQPTSGSEKNSAAGIVNQGQLVKKITDKEKDAFLEKRGALLGNVYSMAFKREIPLALEAGTDHGTARLTMEGAFNYWLDHALYRESAREAYLSKFLQAWENILKYRRDRFWMPVSGGDGYVWQNVIRAYAYNWNPGTSDERREAKVKEILDGNSTLD